MGDLVKRLEALARAEHDDLSVASKAASRIRELEGEVEKWKANHDEMVKRNALLRDRPDLPLERTKAYGRFIAGRDAALADNERLREALTDVGAHLVAATSLLKKGGKKAAPSDKMFHMMIPVKRLGGNGETGVFLK